VSSERPRRERDVARPLLSPRVLCLVALGGAIGSLARYGLDLLLPHAPDGVPWATLLANVVGSLLLGATAVWLVERRQPRLGAYPFAATGILGGFTTFSTYAVQTRVLVGEGDPALAAAYVVGTLLLALGAVRAGTVLTRRLLARAAR
jgi:CrcB protein